MITEAWQSSWTEFLKAVASLMHDDCSEDHIAEYFAGKDIQWSGAVSELKLNSKFAPGVAMKMPMVNLPIKDGKYIQEDHLYVLIANSDKAPWEMLNEGTVVSFHARIRKMGDSGPFLPIRLFFNRDGHVNVQISADNGRLI